MIGAYAGFNPDSNSLRIVLINRDMENRTAVKLTLKNPSLSQTEVKMHTLGADLPLNANNMIDGNKVTWKSGRVKPDAFYLEPHTVNVVNIPLEAR